jgi:hypothetical protein
MTVFAVITKVPHNLTGNYSCSVIYVYPRGKKSCVGANLLVDPPTTIKGYSKLFGMALSDNAAVGEPNTIDLTKRQLVFCNTPVFKLGEILILESKWGRTIPDGRKPSKWDVTYECFKSLKKAIARAKQVTR